jgi:formate hydrogenlyase subunit 5
MAMLDPIVKSRSRAEGMPELSSRVWKGRVTATFDHDTQSCRLQCTREDLVDMCRWLGQDLGFVFATLIVDEGPSEWSLLYIFYRDANTPWVYVDVALDASAAAAPSISGLDYGPSVDWHEREAEDLFGLAFVGHPRLGEFVLHEDWPDGVNPMRRGFDATQRVNLREPDPRWEPPTIVTAPGAFAMPIGPVFSDFAESAHFLLETVGEDVIRTIPRFFYKYRGVEKIAEEQRVDRVLLLAERFSGISAFAHGLAFCQAVEAICQIEAPPRALALRTVFAELERLRHHASVITGICNSTALAVATSQAALIE